MYWLKNNYMEELMKNFKEWIKKNKVVIITVIITLAVILGFSIVEPERGDGIKTCKICNKKEVVLFGYCEKCADSFLEGLEED